MQRKLYSLKRKDSSWKSSRWRGIGKGTAQDMMTVRVSTLQRVSSNRQGVTWKARALSREAWATDRYMSAQDTSSKMASRWQAMSVRKMKKTSIASRPIIQSWEWISKTVREVTTYKRVIENNLKLASTQDMEAKTSAILLNKPLVQSSNFLIQSFQTKATQMIIVISSSLNMRIWNTMVKTMETSKISKSLR